MAIETVEGKECGRRVFRLGVRKSYYGPLECPSPAVDGLAAFALRRPITKERRLLF
jgi:hypothetical protein